MEFQPSLTELQTLLSILTSSLWLPPEIPGGICQNFQPPRSLPASSCPFRSRELLPFRVKSGRQEREGGKKKIMNINLNSSEFQLGRVRAPQIFEQRYCKQGGKSRSVTLTHKYAQKINFVLAVHATFTAIPLLIPGSAEGEEAVNGINIPI